MKFIIKLKRGAKPPPPVDCPDCWGVFENSNVWAEHWHATHYQEVMARVEKLRRELEERNKEK